MTKIDCTEFGVQTRKRLLWTNFTVDVTDINCVQTWEDVLEPVKIVKKW